ncbi:MAG: TRAP transporter substrate-binding protein DctP [Thermodesulfobacteriota bacterium]
MKKSRLILMMLGVGLTGFVFSGPLYPSACAAKKHTLSMVTFLPANFVSMLYVGKFRDKINERSKGELFIDWKGAAEVIPMMDQPEAVRKGVVDIVVAPTAWSESRIPQATILQLSERTPTEERQVGFHDWLNKKIQKGLNSYYLGRVRSNAYFYTFVNKEVKRPMDLANKKMGVTPLYLPFAKALGTAQVSIPEPEFFTALQSGLIDGFFLSAQATLDYRLPEVCKYMINHGWYGANNVVLYVNLDAWNKLPDQLKKLMNDTMIETEPEMAAGFLDLDKKAVKGLLEAGMKEIKFSPEDEGWYLKKASELWWEKTKTMVTAQEYGELRKFLLKKP